jgi:hypothetical protein
MNINEEGFNYSERIEVIGKIEIKDIYDLEIIRT